MILRERVREVWAKALEGASRLRVWLRRVMPRVAAVAGALFVVRLLLAQTKFLGTSVGTLFESVTLLLVIFTATYYGFKALRWLRRRLLWRVRRRLAITYLFIGLTPIVLLTALGLMFALSTSIEGMARLVTIQVEETQRDALENARILADSFAALPANTDEARVRAWLDERTRLLQASMPGARLALWRGSAGRAEADANLSEPARFTSEPAGEEARGVGNNETPLGAPLPAWLRQQLSERGEWNGFTYFPPANSKEFFGAPSVRAVVRREAGGQTFALLLVVPVSRALVRQYSERAGVRLHPFFPGPAYDKVDIRIGEEGSDFSISGHDEEQPAGGTSSKTSQSAGAAGSNNANSNAVQESGTGGRQDAGRLNARDLQGSSTATARRDQLGEPIGSTFTPVTLDATNWLNGQSAERFAFLVDWSFAEASRQILGVTELGQVMRSVLIYIGGFFLVLELLAILAAAWMTRAVTGTVHRLYQATEYIKRGDFSHRVRVRSHDQLGELAVAFNEMSANIQSLLQERVERERLEREIEIAAQVQAQLFPRSVPRLANAEIAGECRAARGVAGDYYDYIEVADKLVAFTLADVSGKGISASLVMSNLQATLRAQTSIIAERMRSAGAATAAASVAPASVGGDGVAEMPCGVTGIDESCAVENMVTSINDQLCRNTEASRFATLFLALYEDDARTLRYTNAGHNPPVLLRKDGKVERLTEGGMMVGAFDWAKYAEARTSLAPGDLLLVFSDGITEAQNAIGEEYGEERLIEFVRRHRDLPAGEVRSRIFEEIDRWSGSQERDDDQTLVILKAAGK